MDWWEDEGARRRKRRSALLPVVGLGVVLAAIGAYAAFGPAREGAAPAATKSTAPPRPTAIEDRRTLEPLTLAAPTPRADELVGERFTRLVYALEKRARATGTDAEPAARAEVDRARDALLAPEVGEVLGKSVAPAVKELVTALEDAEALPGADAGDDTSAKAAAVEVAVARLDNALLVERQPYFVDAVVLVEPTGRRAAPVSTFAITETSLYASAGVRVRSLRVRRLDHAGWKCTLTGFVNPYRPFATVLLDQADEELVATLAHDAPLAVPPVHLADLDAGAPSALEELGQALAARRALFATWDARLRPLGQALPAPRQLAFDVAAFERDPRAAVPAAELADLKKAQARLDKPEVVRGYGVVREEILAAIETHEVQHRLDAVRGIPMPAAIDALVPATPAEEAKRERIQAELSAYLAEMARAPELARVTLDLLARFLADPETRGGAESYAALVALEALAKELGVPDASPLLRQGVLDEARFARAERAVTNKAPDALAAAAGRAWAALFGRALDPVERVGAPATTPPPSGSAAPVTSSSAHP